MCATSLMCYSVRFRGKERQDGGKEAVVFYCFTVCDLEFCRVDAPLPAVPAVNNFTGSAVCVNSPNHLLLDIL